MDAVGLRPPAIYVLDVDPDLARGVPAAEQGEARERSIARVLSLEESGWDVTALPAAAVDWLGLLVVDGLLIRRVLVGARASCELFGVGDVLRPWDEDIEYSPLPITVEWLIIQPARLAVLDAAFARRVARWPAIAAELMRRMASRARHLSLTAAFTHIPRIDSRLLVLYWLLAERWGRVTPDGVLIRLPITHQILAMLVGSRRPSVTIALQRLARDELVIRRGRDEWLLTRKALEAPHGAQS